MAVIGSLGLVIIFFLPRFEKIIYRIILALPVKKEDFKYKIIGISGQFISGLQSIANVSRASRFILFTFIVWFMDAVGVVFLSQALSLNIQLIEAFILLAGLGLSSVIPSTPGYIGVYQYVSVMVFVPLGYQSAEAVAFILLSQIINLLIIILWGGLAIWRIHRNIGSRAPNVP